MLERARRKSPTVEWVRGDVLALPFEDGGFDAATVGFGIRNVEDLEGGLRELARVLRPGGRLGCLEITRPRGALKPFFGLWFDGLVPLAGKVLPGGAAYTYLPASVRRFPGPEHLGEAMRRAGFGEIGWRLLGGGSQGERQDRRHHEFRHHASPNRRFNGRRGRGSSAHPIRFTTRR